MDLTGLLPAHEVLPQGRTSDLWSGSREAILKWPSSLPGREALAQARTPGLWLGSFTIFIKC